MSDILIRGMEMPVFEHQSWDIRKGTDGKWYMVDTNAETSDGAWHEIVSVPSHGRLIDADALVDKHFGKEFLSKVMTANKNDLGTALVNIPLVINNAPTIIPASEEGE